ncbi:copper chaperone PCu(A)C [Roseibium algae]|uniref:Copper chaperone PCu(A)C n=1 Tax=Roseibium algae TaxID=3123038 RepID=A0ABU8TGZ3_9HYPH
MTFFKTLAAAAMMSLVATASYADHASHGHISVTDTWTRATPPKAMSGGGFAKISNGGSEDDRLIAVSSPAASRVELHEMVVSDGVMKMRQMENGIEVPAGETVSLQPGGLHIMFMKLAGPFKEGETVPVTLTFEKAGDVSINLAIEKLGAKGMDHGAMDHSKMDHGDMAKDKN